jgi:hypothetical protein
LSLARTIGEVARTSASPCRAASQLSTKRTRSSATVATRLLHIVRMARRSFSMVYQIATTTSAVPTRKARK